MSIIVYLQQKGLKDVKEYAMMLPCEKPVWAHWKLPTKTYDVWCDERDSFQ